MGGTRLTACCTIEMLLSSAGKFFAWHWWVNGALTGTFAEAAAATAGAEDVEKEDGVEEEAVMSAGVGEFGAGGVEVPPSLQPAFFSAMCASLTVL